MNYPLIVFDWDGTLFDSTALIVRCIQSAAADLGTAIPSDTQAAYVIGMGLQEALQHAVPTFPRERYAELAHRYRHHYFARQHELTLFPGTLDMLHALKARGHVLGIATGKSRRGLDEALRSVELQGLFDATRTADETASKPHPLMLHELMAEAGAAAAHTLMIGDTTHDLQLAANAGAAAVAVSFGAHEREAFDVHAPRFVAHSTRELHDWLLAHG
ncbi:MAG TPA: HAD-IA family hydrolase [Methylibium sp.]|nr:HAD-IA family hydrolase [Methylibium sp.]